MPFAKTDIPRRETPPALPAYQFSDDQLARFVAILPPVTAATRPDWQVSRRKRFRKAIGALHPTDAAQWHIAANLVMARHLVKNMTGRAGARWNLPEDTRWLDRQAARLARVGDVLQRRLRRQQTVAARRGGEPAPASPGLAQEAPSRNEALQREAADLAGVAPAAPAAASGVIGRMQGRASKAPGQRR